MAFDVVLVFVVNGNVGRLAVTLVLVVALLVMTSVWVVAPIPV